MSRRGAKWADVPPGAIAASVADMELAPPDLALDAVRAELDRRSGYPSAAEIDRVVTAGVAWVGSRHGLDLDAGRCIPVSSVAAAAAWTIARLTDPGDGVVRLRPGYPPLAAAVRSLGRGDRAVDLVADGTGGWRLDLDALERACTGARLLLWVSPHNPTGRVWTAEEVAAVAAVAARHGLHVVADEVWADVVLGGRRHVPFAAVAAAEPGLAERTVTAVTATKPFNLAGMGCGLLHAGSAELLATLRGTGRVPMVPTPGRAGLAATAAVWRDGGPWLADTLAHLTRVVGTSVEALAAAYGDDRVTVPEATYAVWLDLRGLAPGDDPVAALAVPDGVVPTDGAAYEAPGHVRLNLATTTAEAAEVVARVQRLVPGRT